MLNNPDISHDIFPDDIKILYDHKKHRLDDNNYKINYPYHFVICTSDHQSKSNKFPLSEIRLNSENIPYTELTDLGEICEKAILAIPDYYSYADVLMYSIMPNHIHILLKFEGEVNPDRKSALHIINSLKRTLTKKIGYSIWQRSYYDTIGVNDKAFEKMQEYIVNNPAKWYFGKHDDEQDW